MNRFCIGETLSATEKKLVANIFIFQKLKGQNVEYYNKLKELLSEHKILLDFQQLIANKENSEELYFSEILKSLKKCVDEITKDYVENFLYSLNLSIKECYFFDEIMNSIHIKKIIIKENVMININALKNTVINMDRSAEGVLNFFFDGPTNY